MPVTNLCFQCLSPGFKAGHKGTCFDKYICPHESHRDFKQGLHVLICDKHKDDDANRQLLDTFRGKCITFPNSEHHDFSRNITLYAKVEVPYNIARTPGKPCGKYPKRKHGISNVNQVWQFSCFRKSKLVIIITICFLILDAAMP